MRIALARGLPQVTPGAGFDEDAARAAGIEIVLPIGEDAAPVGFLGIGSSSRGALSDDEMGFVRALLGLAASGIQNAHAHAESRQLNRDLDQKVQDLRTLLDSSFRPKSCSGGDLAQDGIAIGTGHRLPDGPGDPVSRRPRGPAGIGAATCSTNACKWARSRVLARRRDGNGMV